MIAKLKAVQDMSSAQLQELLSSFMHQCNFSRWAHVNWLSTLPAARELPADWMRQNMQEAQLPVVVQQRNKDMLSALCSFPAAANVGPNNLLQLMDLAANSGSH